MDFWPFTPSVAGAAETQVHEPRPRCCARCSTGPFGSSCGRQGVCVCHLKNAQKRALRVVELELAS